MFFETCELPSPYDAFVESVFHYKGFEPDHSIERVVPTGHVFVLFELDGFERQTFDNDTLNPNARFRGAWVSGMHRNHLSISAHQNSEILVIQFKAFGAHPFLHLPMSEIADRVMPGEAMLDGELLELRDRLVREPASSEKFAVVQRWLAARFDASKAAPEPVVRVVERLQADPVAKLSTACAGYAGSQKHLINQFKHYVGLTPKQFQRVLRFNGVFAQMQGEQSLSWADLAARCGYSDQSHFIREFKAFSGFVPEAFVKQGFDEEAGNFFPLDRGG